MNIIEVRCPKGHLALRLPFHLTVMSEEEAVRKVRELVRAQANLRCRICRSRRWQIKGGTTTEPSFEKLILANFNVAEQEANPAAISNLKINSRMVDMILAQRNQ